MRSVAGVALLAMAAIACRNSVTVQTATATRSSLVVPILADGNLEPPPGGEVRAPEGGVVGAIFAREGQRVVRGTPVLRLDNPDLAQRVFASRAESAQLAEEQKRSSVESAALQRDRDRLRTIVDSDARLLKSGAITAQQKATDDWNYQQTAERAREAEAHSADLVKRKQIVDASAHDLQSRAASLVLHAPVDGVVYNLPRVAGVSIPPGQLVATVADPTRVRVRVRVDSPDLPRVHTGQRLIVTFDGMPNKQWEGRVVLVPPGLREVAGREVGEIIGEISGDATGLPANASVNVEIIVAEKPSALVIPRAALFREGATRFVFRVDDGHARRTVVDVGLIAPNDVEVVRGLREGDRLILPGTAPLRDGEAVKTTS
jgi:RND family efflux transporter MFP subunit